MPDTYTFDDLKSFVLSQRDERRIDMLQGGDSISDQNISCGCILVQFGRRKYKRKIQHVGYSTLFFKNNRMITATDRDEKKCHAVIRQCLDHGVDNYKQAKEIINKY